MKATRGMGAIAALVLVGGIVGQGSSHREAPGITKTPKVDGTDFYMFRSYEPGRDGYVTLIANYVPLQDPYGGPNYFALDTDAVYEIHVDNNGDAMEDLTFQFRPAVTVKDLSVSAGGILVPVPLINIGQVGPTSADVGALNREETYTRQHHPWRSSQRYVTSHHERDRRLGDVSKAGRQHRQQVDSAVRDIRQRSHLQHLDTWLRRRTHVRRAAERPVRRQPRRDLRPRQRHQPARYPRMPKPTIWPTRTSRRSCSKCRLPASCGQRASRSSVAGPPPVSAWV